MTGEQEKWLAHLDNKKKIEILPYDPKTKEIFEKIKKEIQDVLGNIEIDHRGSTALQILGQGEIDLYIPVAKEDFNDYLEKLIIFLGKPGSIYPLQRVRFVIYRDQIKVEIFLINKEADDWKNMVRFENYLKNNREELNRYERLKKESRGLTVQEYYRRKIEFINKILKNA